MRNTMTGFVVHRNGEILRTGVAPESMIAHQQGVGETVIEVPFELNASAETHYVSPAGHVLEKKDLCLSSAPLLTIMANGVCAENITGIPAGATVTCDGREFPVVDGVASITADKPGVRVFCVDAGIEFKKSFVTVAAVATMDQELDHARRTIDLCAESARTRHVPSVGQGTVYLMKEAAARAFLSTGVEPEILRIEADLLRVTVTELAQSIVAAADLWAGKVAKIEGARRAAKMRLDAARTHADIEAVVRAATEELGSF